jgi:ethanolamine phosphate phosphodiesterase
VRQGNFLKRILTIPTLLIFLWAWTIWRGERSVFQTSVAECRWDNWEHWVDI